MDQKKYNKMIYYFKKNIGCRNDFKYEIYSKINMKISYFIDCLDKYFYCHSQRKIFFKNNIKKYSIYIILKS